MRFARQFEREHVPEWRDFYIQYSYLKKQIKKIKARLLSMALHVEISGIQRTKYLHPETGEIQIDLLKEEEVFWILIAREIKKVDEFYKNQIVKLEEQFLALIGKSFQKNLISDFQPLKYTRFERELERKRKNIFGELFSKMEEEARFVDLEDSEETSLSDLTSEQSQTSFSPKSEIESPHSIPPTSDIESLRKRMKNNSEPVPSLEELKKEKELNFISKEEIKKAFSEYYLNLLLLQSFVNLNTNALRKIVKKHFKYFGQCKRNDIYENSKQLTFSKKEKLEALMNETEQIYARVFTNGQRTKAMNELRSSRSGYSGKEVTNTNYYLGLNMGLCLPLLFLIIYFLFFYPIELFPRFYSVMVIYRMLAIGVLMIWFWGLDMLIWNHFRVNYVLILEFDPRDHILHQHMFLAASLFSFVWALSLLFYLIGSLNYPGFVWLNDLPWQIHPLLLLGVYIISLVVFQIKSKFWLLKTIKRIILSPFSPVLFRDAYLGDQLVSLVIFFTDLEYTLCFFLYDAWADTDECNITIQPYAKPFFALLPVLWRLLQCIRRYKDTKIKDHLFNCGKYIVSLFVTMFSIIANSDFRSPFFYFWLIFVMINTLYSYYWDIFKDWGIENWKSIRARRIYPKFTYRVVIVSDLLLRLMWTLTISPESLGIVLEPFIFTTILAAIEIMRRAQWNIFRLENEHLNNKTKLKAVQDIPINVENYRGHFDEIKQITKDLGTTQIPSPMIVSTHSNLESKFALKNLFSEPKPTTKKSTIF